MSYWRTVTTDPVDKSALTCEVWFEPTGPVARLGVGPGVGPHVTSSPQSFREWASAVSAAADAFDAAHAMWDAARVEQGVLAL